MIFLLGIDIFLIREYVSDYIKSIYFAFYGRSNYHTENLKDYVKRYMIIIYLI